MLVIIQTSLLLLCLACEHSERIETKNIDTEYSSDTLKVNKLLKKVAANEEKGDIDILTDILLAENLSIKQKYTYGLGRALFFQGNYYYGKNDLQKAMSLYQKSLSIAESSNDMWLRANCLERMGSVQLDIDPFLSYKYYYESLFLFEQINSLEGIAKVYNVIGFSNARRNPEKGEQYLFKALAINTKINNHKGMLHNKANLGYLYECNNEFEKAEKIYFELVEKLIMINDSLDLPIIYYNIASLNQSRNNFDTAIAYIRKSIPFGIKSRDTVLLSNLYGNIGELFAELQMSDSAYFYLKRSIQCSEVYNDITNQAHALKLMEHLDSMAGNYADAYKKRLLISDLTEKEYETKIKNSLKETELQYENNKKNYQLQVQKLTLDASNKKKQSYTILFVISVISIVFIVLYFIARQRNLKKEIRIHAQELQLKTLENEQKHQELEISRLILKNNENEKRLAENQLLNLSLSVKQKSELLEDISKKLKIKDMKNKGDEQSLHEIISQISSHKTGLNENTLFNEKFSSLHPNFFKSLKEKYPTLTKTEMNFCALIKIHLTGKQIATMLNVGPEAVRKTRYRIRKKMHLDADQSLEDIISAS